MPLSIEMEMFKIIIWRIKMKKVILSLLIIVMMLSSIACTQEPSEVQDPEVPMAVTLPEVDRAGNDINVPEEINSIISLAPSITQVLVDLGFGDKLIAVDNQSKGIVELPEGIAYLDLMSPDAEQIIALNPDIILASTITQQGGSDPLSALKDMGVTIAYIPSSDSIEGIYEDINFISSLLQVTEKGNEMIEIMKSKIAGIKKMGDAIEDKKTVYFEISAAPYLYSFGKGVFLDEMISIIGAENVLADQTSWISVSDEVILDNNPDVILTSVNYIENPVEEIMSRPGWDKITAVQNKEVYYIDNMASSLPNHNIIKALEEMLKAVYPENK